MKLDPSQDKTLTIMGLFEQEFYVAGVGCNPTLAWVDLREVHGDRRYRLGMAHIEYEDGTQDWSFLVTQVAK